MWCSAPASAGPLTSQPGQPGSLSQEERDQRQEQLAQQAARAEINSYALNVSDAASVTIPDDILNPPLF